MALDDLLVRPMVSADVKRVRELHARVLPVQYPPAFFLQLLIMPNQLCLVAVQSTQPAIPIGFVSAALHTPAGEEVAGAESQSVPPPRLELLTLGVAPAYQQCGLATRLVTHIVQRVRESILPKLSVRAEGLLTCAHVSTNNTRAIAFYRRLGMVAIPGTIRGLYRTSSGPRDAYLVMGVL
ncbi:hypothetical protein MD484_g4079, partial [Candolleomyces efflorescens]